MSSKYVFLLGRPGCGKSAVYRELENRIAEAGIADSFERVDDFPKLWATFMKDNELEEQGKERIYSRRTDDSGYKVINNDVWNAILKDLNNDIVNIDKNNHIVFIEFARADNVEALTNFSEKILDNAIVIYIDVNFEICWQRNVARHEAAIAEGGDDHLVSREEMEETYLNDDRDVLKDYDRVPVAIVNNEKEGLDHLVNEVDNVMKILTEKFKN